MSQVEQTPSLMGARWFWTVHGWGPGLVFALSLLVLVVLHGDFVVADSIYALEGGRWLLRTHVVTEQVIHVYGRNISLAAWLGVLILYAWACARRGNRAARRALGCLVLATLLSVTLVSLLKATSNMDCPWALIRYGGGHDFIPLFSPRPASMPRGKCFPAGHASGAYCWVALYFFFALTRPRLRIAGLAGALVCGLVFGVSQQLRGAHFLSHDVVTLAICWFVSLGCHVAMFGPTLNGAAGRRSVED